MHSPLDAQVYGFYAATSSHSDVLLFTDTDYKKLFRVCQEHGTRLCTLNLQMTDKRCVVVVAQGFSPSPACAKDYLKLVCTRGWLTNAWGLNITPM